MTRYITGILILLLVSVATSQAQRKEPEIKACERQIEKLKKAPDDVTFARGAFADFAAVSASTGVCMMKPHCSTSLRRRLGRAGHQSL